ncbi:MAG: LamG-like jellyroll fold domain-containing protein [Planctomycetota bacterium]|jgi:hypothetical protein
MKAKTILVAISTVSILSSLTPAQWTEPIPVSEINSDYADWTPFLSFDGLSLYFARVRTDTFNYARIFEATREVPYGPFTSISEVLSPSGQHAFGAWVSPDNLRMYYRVEIESQNRWLLKVSERTSVNDPWPHGTDISELNQFGKLHTATLTADELIIIFGSYDIPDGLGGYDLWMATRPDRYSQFGPVTNMAGINTDAHEVLPSVSPDGFTLYFSSNRNEQYQLFRATRQSLTEPFGNVEHLSLFDTPGGLSAHPCISSDGSALYFIKQLGDDKSTGDIYVSYDPYMVAVRRIEDAIAEKLDALDRVNAALEKEWVACDALQELLESGDYGDLKKGDIITAIQKIHSSIQHEELAKKTLDRSIEKLEDALAALGWQPPPEPDPSLVAYWTFDEGQGTIAYDSVGTNNGTVHEAAWTTGQINGALSFDGMNDYVDMADTVKNYLETSYTISLWIKADTLISNKAILGYRHSTDVNPVLFQIGHNNEDVGIDVRDNSHDVVKAIYPNALTTNTWYHLAGVREENTINIYVNGVSGNPGSGVIEAISPDNFKIGAFHFGGNPVSNYFNGNIDDVMIFDIALSAQEIQQLYNNGSAGL